MDDVVVIGAGVIGLTTGACLAEAGLRVRIRTAGPPASTTSAAAGALIGPAFVEPADRVVVWNAATVAAFSALAGDPATGVRIMRGTMVSRSGGPPASPSATPVPPEPAIPPQLSSLPGFRIRPAGELPAGYLAGIEATLPVVDMPVYLEYLVARFAAAGGVLEHRPVGSLAQVAAEAPVIVNCTGVAARDLAGDPDVRPVRGQHVLVDNPGLDEYFVEGGAPSSEFVAILPHGRHVILGGVAEVDSWSLEPDPSTAERILSRCAAMEPRLRGARVIGHRVGLRPDRASGVRLDEERVGAARCIHSYGHGSVGVALSWGCAREVAALLTPSASPGTSGPTTRYT
jgi:D-amino-acid oxidase